MSSAIEGLKPALVWKYFAEVVRIPRCSKNEAGIRKYVLNTAKRLGMQAKADGFGNVVAKMPASPGREHVRGVVLQGHLDMVCEKNKETIHDFTKDPIEIVRKGNVLTANGTTLGADNGIAVATNLAIMEDRSLEHGPLEFLFTVDEETGLTGASNLSSDSLKGRTLLNLDSEEEGVLYVGCSGGRDTNARWKADFDKGPANTIPAHVKVAGLRGGHSGLEIDKGRGNAIKVLNRVLVALSDHGLRFASIEGGNKHNAIPREAEAIVFVPKRAWDEFVSMVRTLNDTIKSELAVADRDLSISIIGTKAVKNAKVLKKAHHVKLLRMISALPHGVMKMSTDIPGLVETSTNVAVIKTLKNGIIIGTSQRSSVESELLEISQSVSAVFELVGAKIEQTGGYPGWKPNLNSPILQLAKETYKSLYGKEPDIKAIHAGLECGIIGEKYPGMDMVSFGPTIEAVHSPDERIHIETVEKFWAFLLAILKNID